MFYHFFEILCVYPNSTDQFIVKCLYSLNEKKNENFTFLEIHSRRVECHSKKSEYQLLQWLGTPKSIKFHSFIMLFFYLINNNNNKI